MKKKIEENTEAVVKEKKQRVVPQEQKLVNELFKMMRKNANTFVKHIVNNTKKEEYTERFNTICTEFNNAIAEMQNEIEMEARFASMTEAELNFLKKLLEKENN